MRFCHYQENVSPHVMPLMRRMAQRLGVNEFRYICTSRLSEDRLLMGWNEEGEQEWVIDAGRTPQTVRDWLENCPCLMCGTRDVSLFELRSRKGLKTIYSGERWFKPLLACCGHVNLPGRLRLLSPRYRRLVMPIVYLLKNDPNFFYWGIGPYAVSDMLSLGVPPAKISLSAYYVEPGLRRPRQSFDGITKLLWVGRMIPLKRVDTIIKAFSVLPGDRYQLTLVGDGPERTRLQRLARGKAIEFIPFVSLVEVRRIMRDHDVFIFSSNSYEGWGAVVNEAIEEGMLVVGSRDVGACATLLPESNLFKCGDWRRLSDILRGPIARIGIEPWDVDSGVERLLGMINKR